MKVLSRLTNAFPLWVLLASLLALYQPAWFTWFSGALIPLGLGMIMLGMGLTLTVDDFRGVLKFPGWVLTGVALQYTVMPLCGWAIGLLFQLSPEYAVGLVLVSCCPGGTASNVVSYLGRLDVPLSVTLTAVSTFLAALLTPMLTLFFAGNRLEVNGAGLFKHVSGGDSSGDDGGSDQSLLSSLGRASSSCGSAGICHVYHAYCRKHRGSREGSHSSLCRPADGGRFPAACLRFSFGLSYGERVDSPGENGSNHFYRGGDAEFRARGGSGQGQFREPCRGDSQCPFQRFSLSDRKCSGGLVARTA